MPGFGVGVVVNQDPVKGDGLTDFVLDGSPVIKRLAAQVGVWLGNAEHAAELRKLPDRFLFRMRLCDRLRDRLPQLAHYLMARPSRSVN